MILKLAEIFTQFIEIAHGFVLTKLQLSMDEKQQLSHN